MGHNHTHTHEDRENYFLDQIFTIALCGALGAIAVLMYVRAASASPDQKSMLTLLLDKKFHPYLLAGGITLLVLVVIRAVAVWRLAGETPNETAHAHDHHHHHDHAHHHAHEHAHHHDHEHGAHDHASCCHGHPPHHHHDDGHDHAWSPWRYTVLMLPVVLYFLGLPSEGFSAKFKKEDVEEVTETVAASTAGLLTTPAGPGPLLAASALYPGRNDRIAVGGMVRRIDIANVRFSELERAAYRDDRRRFYSGKGVTLVGKFVAGSDSRQFSVVRYRINCCAADALPLNAILMVHPSWQGEPLNVGARHQQWVKVTGRVYFFKKRGGEEHVPAIILFPDKDSPPNKLVEVISQPGNPWAD